MYNYTIYVYYYTYIVVFLAHLYIVVDFCYPIILTELIV